jgi:hypothetical protein
MAKIPPLRRPAPPDHRIYQLGYVLGGSGRNRLPEGVRKEPALSRATRTDAT